MKKIRKHLRGKKTFIIAAVGSILILLIQFGYFDAANYDKLVDLFTMLGLMSLRSAINGVRSNGLD